MDKVVSFKLSVILKELGYGIDPYVKLGSFYNAIGDYFNNSCVVMKKITAHYFGADTINDFEAVYTEMDNELSDFSLAPTIAEVLMWMEKKYNQWIKVTHILIEDDPRYPFDKDQDPNRYMYTIEKGRMFSAPTQKSLYISDEYFRTLEDLYEDAIMQWYLQDAFMMK